MIVSLDPGLQGNVAVLTDSGEIIASRKMPLDKKRKFSAINTWKLLKGIDDYAKGQGEKINCAIEKLLSLPSDANAVTNLVKKIQGDVEGQMYKPEDFEAIYKELKKTDCRLATKTMGTNWGILVGQITALGWPLTIYSPRTWQNPLFKTAEGKGSTKTKAYEVCCQLWPDKLDLWEKKRGFDDNVCDSLLIGEHHRRQLR